MAEPGARSDAGQRVQVEISGRTYTLKGNRDPKEVKRLAAYVDERMGEITSRTQTADTTRVAILAALNIADELFRARARRDAGGAEAVGAGQSRARDEELIRMLDEALAG